MNIIEKLIDAKIVDNGFHAAGMLNVLECATLETDDQRLDRCRLYIAWKKYFDNSKDFTNKTNAKKQARKNAIAGLAVPELPMLDVVICPICETTHSPDEVELLGSGIGNDKVNWSEWRCLLTGETWTHLEPVPAEVTG